MRLEMSQITDDPRVLDYERQLQKLSDEDLAFEFYQVEGCTPDEFCSNPANATDRDWIIWYLSQEMECRIYETEIAPCGSK